MFLSAFSNNRLVSIFILLAILVLSLVMSEYLPVLEGIDSEGTTASASGETDINKVIAIINANSQKPSGTAEKQAIAGIVLNDKYTEQTINAEALKDLLKNSAQVQSIMNPILPPSSQ
jgi:hypothetical protein